MIIQIDSHTVAIDPRYQPGIIAMYANINKDRPQDQARVQQSYEEEPLGNPPP